MTLRATLLPSLAAFAVAARHLNFAHAAAELHVTASAVSHHVRRLEAQLGVPLFQRHARGVSLTPEGRVLADAAGGAMIEIEAVVLGLRQRRRGARVRVTALPSFATSWLVPRLPAFAAQHPDIYVALDTDRTLARFDDGGPDLGVRYGPGQWPGVASRWLLDDALLPVASPHLPGVRELADLRDIARLPLISDLAMEGWREWFRACGVRGVRLPEMHAFSDTYDALLAAAAGFGVALGRQLLVAPLLADGRLVRLPGPALRTRFSYYLVHPAHRPLSPAARAFAHWLETQVQAAGGNQQDDTKRAAASKSVRTSASPSSRRRAR